MLLAHFEPGRMPLISQSLFGSQESQVLNGNVRRREGSAIASVFKDNTDPMSGLCQLRDDAFLQERQPTHA